MTTDTNDLTNDEVGESPETNIVESESDDSSDTESDETSVDYNEVFRALLERIATALESRVDVDAATPVAVEGPPESDLASYLDTDQIAAEVLDIEEVN